MATSKRNPGISRIDQEEKRTHGFFVRLRRDGKIHNAFFPDKKHNGKGRALKAAQEFYAQLLKKYGPRSRRMWAQIERRKSSSGVVGVRKLIRQVRGRRQVFWTATWSPRPYEIKRKAFSVRKYGPDRARSLAIKARMSGLRTMED